MSFGLRTWNGGGVLEMDTDSFTYQVIHNQTYDLATTPTVIVNIPTFNVSNCVSTILPITTAPNDFINYALPYTKVENGKITVLSKHPNETGPDRTTIAFRLLVMRYKN